MGLENEKTEGVKKQTKRIKMLSSGRNTFCNEIPRRHKRKTLKQHNGVQCYMSNLILLKLVPLRYYYVILASFILKFTFLWTSASYPAHKNARRELDQYLTILTSHLGNNIFKSTQGNIRE